MHENKEHIVIIDDLHYSRGDKKIFRGVNLAIKRGKVTAIMGPSGTGKTTLLRLIGGQLKPDSGQLKVNGSDVPSLSRSKLKQLRRRMGLLFQEGALFSDLNVFENVAFLLREHTKLPEDMIRDLVLMKLEAVGLRGAAGLQTSELSGGMARRVALARAIMLDPELMMYDEPFTGQDPINRGVLLNLIRRLNDAFGLTSVLVSHDVRDVTAVADYIYVLANGTVIGSGTPEEVINDTSPQLQQFVQGLPDGPVPFQYPADNFKQDLGL
ncbi:ABC transporter ATP-binding protein [Candidiatus Paracoxiella cheracis]|uniref:ABC transporter ATP-binding protein n=1 Tax=Candidiatus Paracoxiella cheracis TaxID=3405120 RepID=UPI003BF55978